jgi:hypothetical protein
MCPGCPDCLFVTPAPKAKKPGKTAQKKEVTPVVNDEEHKTSLNLKSGKSVNSAVTPAEKEHGHRITYTLDTLERDAKVAGLKVVHRSGIFFKALANFQWDKLLQTDIISKEYLDGCYQLGQQYPELCSSIFLLCKKG